MCNDPDHVVVTTTVDSEEAAAILARKLVKGRFAACVQRLPVHSTYWWKGKVEESAEFLLLAKTRAARSADLIAFIKENHSYEVPEIVVAPITGGLPPYLDWIEKETKEP
jgi:periplasmic divalent cation tolerance protein